MICEPCRAGARAMKEEQRHTADWYHAACRGGTWCCCQHETGRSVLREDRQADPRRGG